MTEIEKAIENLKLSIADENINQTKFIVQMAITALENHVPKKLNYEFSHHGQCPCCGYEFSNSLFEEKIFFHCIQCGQAIEVE